MIAISSTTYDSHQAETVTITAVSDRTISFTPSLQHKHLGKQHSLVKRFLRCLCALFLIVFFLFLKIPLHFCLYLAYSIAWAFSHPCFLWKLISFNFVCKMFSALSPIGLCAADRRKEMLALPRNLTCRKVFYLIQNGKRRMNQYKIIWAN